MIERLEVGGIGVLVPFLLRLLVEIEDELVATLVSYGKIGEEEVAGHIGPVQVGHAGDWQTRQDGWAGGSGRVDAAIGNGAGVFEGCIQKEVCIMLECDVLTSLNRVTLKHSELDNWRRVNRAAVSRG